MDAVIVGAGFAAKSFHAYLLRKESRFRLHGMVVRDPSKVPQVSAELGPNPDGSSVVFFATLDEALALPNVKLIIIATPPESHASMAIQALKAKKHVLVDKPMCVTLQECDEMMAAAKASGVELAVFQNRRLDGDFLTASSLLHSLTLGQVRWIELAWQRSGVPPKDWKAQSHETGGGRFLDLGAHLLDQLLLLFPHPVVSVYCRQHRDFATAPGIESHALLILTFLDGSTGIIDTSSTAAIEKPHFYLVGDKGTFAKFGVDQQEKYMISKDIENTVEPESLYGRIKTVGGAESTVPTLPGQWTRFYPNLADALEGKDHLLVTTASVRRMMAIFHAAFESARTNRSIDLNPHKLDVELEVRDLGKSAKGSATTVFNKNSPNLSLSVPSPEFGRG